MSKTISILCVALLLLIGTVPYADASEHGGLHGGGFEHHPFMAPHRFGYIDRFHSGIFFDVPPLWVAPEPYVEVTPVPPPVWYYCPNPPGYYPAVPSCTVPWTPVYPPA
jgi:hypothetical protein